MKILKALLIVLFLASVTAVHAADQDVRFYSSYNLHDGQSVPLRQVLFLYFVSAPCPLDFAGVEPAHRAWSIIGGGTVGCWVRTADGKPIFIGKDPALSSASDGLYWDALPRAVLHDDDTLTVTEPGYDGPGWVALRTSAAAMRRLQERSRPQDPFGRSSVPSRSR